MVECGATKEDFVLCYILGMLLHTVLARHLQAIGTLFDCNAQAIAWINMAEDPGTPKQGTCLRSTSPKAYPGSGALRLEHQPHHPCPNLVQLSVQQVRMLHPRHKPPVLAPPHPLSTPLFQFPCPLWTPAMVHLKATTPTPVAVHPMASAPICCSQRNPLLMELLTTMDVGLWDVKADIGNCIQTQLGKSSCHSACLTMMITSGIGGILMGSLSTTKKSQSGFSIRICIRYPFRG